MLSLFMMAIALETIEFRESVMNAILLAAVAAVGGWLTLFAWKQFHRLLYRAEALAGQAVCAQCSTYGRFEVLEAHDARDSVTGRSFCVRCRQCRHEWRMG